MNTENTVGKSMPIIINKKQDEYLFDILDFVYRAKSKDSVKPVFIGIYIEDDTIVCTDSRRLHLVKSDIFKKWNDGLFSIKKIKNEFIIGLEEIEGQFPNYKQIIPKKENMILRRFIMTDDDKSLKGIFSGKILYYLENCYNVNFIMDVLTQNSLEWALYEQKKGSMSPALLEAVSEASNTVFTLQSMFMPIQL